MESKIFNLPADPKSLSLKKYAVGNLYEILISCMKLFKQNLRIHRLQQYNHFEQSSNSTKSSFNYVSKISLSPTQWRPRNRSSLLLSLPLSIRLANQLGSYKVTMLRRDHPLIELNLVQSQYLWRDVIKNKGFIDCTICLP